MRETYDLNNVKDLQLLLGQFIDDYVPYQFEQLDSDILEDAIKSCKENGIALTGNNIFAEAVGVGVSKAHDEIYNVLETTEYLDWDISEKERHILESLWKDGEFDLFDLISYCANGSLDSSVYVNPDITNTEQAALKIINEHTDIIDDLTDNLGFDIDFSEIDIYKIDIEQDEPDICE